MGNKQRYLIRPIFSNEQNDYITTDVADVRLFVGKVNKLEINGKSKVILHFNLFWTYDRVDVLDIMESLCFVIMTSDPELLVRQLTEQGVTVKYFTYTYITYLTDMEKKMEASCVNMISESINPTIESTFSRYIEKSVFSYTGIGDDVDNECVKVLRVINMTEPIYCEVTGTISEVKHVNSTLMKITIIKDDITAGSTSAFRKLMFGTFSCVSATDYVNIYNTHIKVNTRCYFKYIRTHGVLAITGVKPHSTSIDKIKEVLELNVLVEVLKKKIYVVNSGNPVTILGFLTARNIIPSLVDCYEIIFHEFYSRHRIFIVDNRLLTVGNSYRLKYRRGGNDRFVITTIDDIDVDTDPKTKD